MRFLKTLNYILYKFQKWFVVAVFLLLLGLSSVQVVLRLFFNTGIANAETMMRYLVLWVGFLGGSLATYKMRHINLDVASKAMRKINKNLFNFLTGLCSSIILGILLYAGVVFIMNEMSDATMVYFVPVWVLETVIPLTFFFMLLVFIQLTLVSGAAMLKGKKQ